MRVSATEREFFQIKANGGAGEPLNSLKRRYFASLFTTKPDEHIRNLTRRYLTYVIFQNGGTVSSLFESDLLKSALVALSVSPTRSLKQNWKLFYLALT